MFDKIRSYLARAISPKLPKLPGKTFNMSQLTRLTNDWISAAQSVNFDLYQGLSVLRARGRDLFMNDPLAKKFVKLAKKNIIGPSGFDLKVRAYEIIKTKEGYKQQFDKFANRLIQDKFWYWMKKKNCTLTGDLSFREANALILSSVIVDGECFIVHLKGKQYGGDYGYTMQLIDPIMVDERYNVPLQGGNYIHMGIEYNSRRKVIAYHFRKVNPFDEIFTGNYTLASDYDRIEAEDVCHLFVKEFINQSRGICWFAPAALRMQMLNKASEAAVINFRVGASKTLGLKPTENVNPDIENAEAKTSSDGYGNILENVEPGETFKVPYGYEPFDINPQYPSGEFGTFVEAIMQQIASAMDTSHPSLSSSYRGTTWTSSRTALIDERDGWKILQGWFSEHLLDDVFSNWLYMSLLSGVLNPLPAEKFEKFNEPFWSGRTWDWVDPEKEENARIKQFKYKFKTFGEIISLDNKDLEEHLENLAEEKALFEKYGIEFPEDIPIDVPEEDEIEKEIEKENSKPKNGKDLKHEYSH